MQSLREQLLKAGLVSEGHKRHLRTTKPRGQAEEAMPVQQRQACKAELASRRAAEAQRAAAEQARREVQEKRLQIQHIVDYWSLPEEQTGARRWYFVTRNKTIRHLYVSDRTATQLSAGEVAIVERPDESEPRYVLVEREAAEYIARIDPEYIRFFNGQLGTSTQGGQ